MKISPLLSIVPLAACFVAGIAVPTNAQLIIDVETAVADGYVGAQSSLKLDKLNRPHICHVRLFEDPALLYTTRPDGETWTTEVVDVPPTGSGYFHYTSMTLDRAGIPHVSYYEIEGGDLYYANRRGGSWTVETIDTEGLVGIQASMALDNMGDPHIAYVDFSEVDLRYAYKRDGVWHREIIDSEGLVGTYPSLAFDKSGRPHISYYSIDDRKLMYATRIGSQWITSVVTYSIDINGCTALSVDRDGFPRIAFRTRPADGLGYAKATPDGWETEIVDIGDRRTRDIAMALDANETPHITFGDDQTGNVHYATKVDGNWLLMEVNPPDEDAEALRVALDSVQRMQPRFTFMAVGAGDLCYAEGRLVPSSVESDLVGRPRLLATPNPARAGEVRLMLQGSQLKPEPIQIFDAAGRQVRQLQVSSGAGAASTTWDGRDESGRSVQAGIYWARSLGSTGTRIVLLR